MGDFRIVIEAVGGHGCERNAKEGEMFFGCGRMGCPDCELRGFLKRLGEGSGAVKSATLTHWPGTTSEVVDEYAVQSMSFGTQVIGRRTKGHF